VIGADEARAAALAKYDHEVATGAPHRMAAVYAVVEMRHATLGHAGDAQSCNGCHGISPTDKEPSP
jgi:hypothetical protein